MVEALPSVVRPLTVSAPFAVSMDDTKSFDVEAVDVTARFVVVAPVETTSCEVEAVANTDKLVVVAPLDTTSCDVEADAETARDVVVAFVVVAFVAVRFWRDVSPCTVTVEEA